MTRFRTALLLLAASLLAAETLDWTPGQTIDVPVPVTTAEDGTYRTRSVVFPANAVTTYATRVPERELEITTQGNRITFALKAAVLEATVEVEDDRQRLYVLRVRSPTAAEDPDDVLTVSDGTRTTAGQLTERTPESLDADAAVVYLMSQMVGGVTDPKIQVGPVTRLERGTMVEGNDLFKDDAAAITAVTAYRWGRYYGVDCVVRWTGTDRPVTWNTQQIWFPGVLAVHAAGQTALAPKHPDIVIPPNAPTRLSFVGVEPERSSHGR